MVKLSTEVRRSVQVDFSGPFFQRDPGDTIMENVQKMMQGVADEGAAAARQGLMAGAGGRALVRMTGTRVADHVVGRVTARPSRGGRNWHTAAVVQVYNEGMGAAESRSLMAAASYVEGQTRAIRNVTRQVRRARAILSANLTAGIE